MPFIALQVENEQKEKIATLHKSHRVGHPLLITIPSSHDKLEIKHPEHSDWSRLDIHWKDKPHEPVCLLHKIWGRANRELLTDADRYELDFVALNVSWRPAVIAAALVFDWLYFHRL